MVMEKADSLAKEDLKLGDSGIKWIWLAVLAFILDQITKYWVSAEFDYREVVEVLPVFNLTLAHNYGAAFSILSDAGGWQRWFFTLLALIASVIILSWLRHTSKRQRVFSVGMNLILGGALGNLYDRVVHG